MRTVLVSDDCLSKFTESQCPSYHRADAARRGWGGGGEPEELRRKQEVGHKYPTCLLWQLHLQGPMTSRSSSLGCLEPMCE